MTYICGSADNILTVNLETLRLPDANPCSAGKYFFPPRVKTIIPPMLRRC